MILMIFLLIIIGEKDLSNLNNEIEWNGMRIQNVNKIFSVRVMMMMFLSFLFFRFSVYLFVSNLRFCQVREISC